MPAERKTCAWAAERNEPHPVCYGWGCDTAGCHRKKHAAQQRKTELAQYRKFPGNDLQQARRERMEAAVAHLGPMPPWRQSGIEAEEWLAERQRIWKPLRMGAGRCNWCEGEIYKPGVPVLNLRRGWHDGRGEEPDCLAAYYHHTRTADQFALILRRDGTCCASCGAEMGRWQAGHAFTPERVRAWGPKWLERYPPDVYVGDFTTIHLTASLEVDHRLALALVALTIDPAERWRYYGPMNLQGLCHDCHVAKTRDDVRLIKAARTQKETTP